MQPMETLRNEHGLIRQCLDNLSMAVEKLENEERPPREVFDKAVQFARSFADGLHHFKEEHVVFVRVAQKKGGEYDAQIDALRQQHERGRNHINAIAQSLDGYEEGKPIPTSDLIENVAAYVALLRNHIHTEDHVFFPMAEQELSAEEMEQVQVEFDRAREKAGEDAFEANHAIVVDMGSLLVHM